MSGSKQSGGGPSDQRESDQREPDELEARLLDEQAMEDADAARDGAAFRPDVNALRPPLEQPPDAGGAVVRFREERPGPSSNRGGSTSELLSNLQIDWNTILKAIEKHYVFDKKGEFHREVLAAHRHLRLTYDATRNKSLRHKSMAELRTKSKTNLLGEEPDKPGRKPCPVKKPCPHQRQRVVPNPINIGGFSSESEGDAAAIGKYPYWDQPAKDRLKGFVRSEQELLVISRFLFNRMVMSSNERSLTVVPREYRGHQFALAETDVIRIIREYINSGLDIAALLDTMFPYMDAYTCHRIIFVLLSKWIFKEFESWNNEIMDRAGTIRQHQAKMLRYVGAPFSQTGDHSVLLMDSHFVRFLDATSTEKIKAMAHCVAYQFQSMEKHDQYLLNRGEKSRLEKVLNCLVNDSSVQSSICKFLNPGWKPDKGQYIPGHEVFKELRMSLGMLFRRYGGITSVEKEQIVAYRTNGPEKDSDSEDMSLNSLKRDPLPEAVTEEVQRWRRGELMDALVEHIGNHPEMVACLTKFITQTCRISTTKKTGAEDDSHYEVIHSTIDQHISVKVAIPCLSSLGDYNVDPAPTRGSVLRTLEETKYYMHADVPPTLTDLVEADGESPLESFPEKLYPNGAPYDACCTNHNMLAMLMHPVLADKVNLHISINYHHLERDLAAVLQLGGMKNEMEPIYKPNAALPSNYSNLFSGVGEVDSTPYTVKFPPMTEDEMAYLVRTYPRQLGRRLVMSPLMKELLEKAIMRVLLPLGRKVIVQSLLDRCFSLMANQVHTDFHRLLFNPVGRENDHFQCEPYQAPRKFVVMSCASGIDGQIDVVLTALDSTAATNIPTPVDSHICHHILFHPTIYYDDQNGFTNIPADKLMLFNAEKELLVDFLQRHGVKTGIPGYDTTRFLCIAGWSASSGVLHRMCCFTDLMMKQSGTRTTAEALLVNQSAIPLDQKHVAAVATILQTLEQVPDTVKTSRRQLHAVAAASLLMHCKSLLFRAVMHQTGTCPLLNTWKFHEWQDLIQDSSFAEDLQLRLLYSMKTFALQNGVDLQRMVSNRELYGPMLAGLYGVSQAAYGGPVGRIADGSVTTKSGAREVLARFYPAPMVDWQVRPIVGVGVDTLERTFLSPDGMDEFKRVLIDSHMRLLGHMEEAADYTDATLQQLLKDVRMGTVTGTMLVGKLLYADRVLTVILPPKIRRGRRMREYIEDWLKLVNGAGNGDAIQSPFVINFQMVTSRIHRHFINIGPRSYLTLYALGENYGPSGVAAWWRQRSHGYNRLYYIYTKATGFLFQDTKLDVRYEETRRSSIIMENMDNAFHRLALSLHFNQGNPSMLSKDTLESRPLLSGHKMAIIHLSDAGSYFVVHPQHGDFQDAENPESDFAIPLPDQATVGLRKTITLARIGGFRFNRYLSSPAEEECFKNPVRLPLDPDLGVAPINDLKATPRLRGFDGMAAIIRAFAQFGGTLGGVPIHYEAPAFLSLDRWFVITTRMHVQSVSQSV